jgi:hypothetical protein
LRTRVDLVYKKHQKRATPRAANATQKKASKSYYCSHEEDKEE